MIDKIIAWFGSLSRNKRYIPVALIVAGILLLLLGARRTVTLVIDGQVQPFSSRAPTVGLTLRQAGVAVGNLDRVSPPTHTLLGWRASIVIERARPVFLWSSSPGFPKFIITPERIPANILADAGIQIYPGDRIYWNGTRVDPGLKLTPTPNLVLDYHPGIPITIHDRDHTTQRHSAAATIGDALWEAGIVLEAGEQASVPLDTPLREPVEVTIARANPITITVDNKTIQTITSAHTVGEALASAGVSLQDLDYSQPAEDQPIPEDRAIEVVRVQEEVVLEQSTIPYTSDYIEDSETELDQQSIVSPGEYGLQVSRLRVRYENGQEVSREEEANWVAKQPVPQQVGYGTKVVIRTLDTPNGPVEYWRAIQVYATAYSPCGLGDVPKCYYGTAYGLPVKRGVVGVIRSWYNLMAGQGVYVPGYGPGIIADIGGGIPGKDWIDLGFTDEELEEWHHYVTMYFLTPVPAVIPYILP
ncbi:MAG: DUF348 domain-containing protein [Anaerolineae bacterium]|nr:DUF348 domain-containing protein [Anaerolineae bacterium]